MKKAITDPPPETKPSLLKKWGWLITIWFCSVLALFAVSSLFRFFNDGSGNESKVKNQLGNIKIKRDKFPLYIS